MKKKIKTYATYAVFVVLIGLIIYTVLWKEASMRDDSSETDIATLEECGVVPEYRLMIITPDEIGRAHV